MFHDREVNLSGKSDMEARIITIKCRGQGVAQWPAVKSKDNKKHKDHEVIREASQVKNQTTPIIKKNWLRMRPIPWRKISISAVKETKAGFTTEEIIRMTTTRQTASIIKESSSILITRFFTTMILTTITEILIVKLSIKKTMGEYSKETSTRKEAIAEGTTFAEMTENRTAEKTTNDLKMNNKISSLTIVESNRKIRTKDRCSASGLLI